jgi:putative copper resistance protein D
MPDMPMPRVLFTLGHTFTSWDLSIFPIAVIVTSVAIGSWYLRAEWALALRGRAWPRSRTISFLSGLVVVDLAFCSSVAVYAGTYFQAHVIQHLMLMVVAPPLLALGAPSTLLLQTGRRATKERWLRVLRSTPFAALSHPVTVFFLYFGSMFAFFLTSAIGFAMDHMAVMDLVNLGFLLGSTLYWWPMVGIDPIIHWKLSYGFRLLNILLSSGLEAFLGVAILSDSRPVAPIYSLPSTHSGGALLWVATEFVTLGAFLPIYVQWARSEDRLAAREDRRRDMEAAEAAASGVGFAIPHAPGWRDSAWQEAFAAKGSRVPMIQDRRPERRAAGDPAPPAR